MDHNHRGSVSDTLLTNDLVV
jgi:hypothetical protein